MPLQIDTLAPELSDAEGALVRRAFEGWDAPDAFSDADVGEVKTLFARLFGLDEADVALVGRTIADALLLNETDRCDAYYAAVRLGTEWTWKRVVILPEEGDRRRLRTEILDPSITFVVLLLMLA